MLPQDDIPPDIVFAETDRQSLRRVFIIAALILFLVLLCGLWPREAGAQKRPTPPARICVADVVSQDTGYYRAVVDGAPALVFARSARRPVLRVGCYQAAAFKAEWRIQR